jgi:hypothetical protein
MVVRNIPKLDEVAEYRHLADLESNVLVALITQAAATQAVLASALLRRQQHERRVSGKLIAVDEWLDPQAAAKLAKLTARSFFRHSPPCGCERCRGRAI